MDVDDSNISIDYYLSLYLLDIFVDYMIELLFISVTNLVNNLFYYTPLSLILLSGKSSSLNAS